MEPAGQPFTMKPQLALLTALAATKPGERPAGVGLVSGVVTCRWQRLSCQPTYYGSSCAIRSNSDGSFGARPFTDRCCAPTHPVRQFTGWATTCLTPPANSQGTCPLIHPLRSLIGVVYGAMGALPSTNRTGR